MSLIVQFKSIADARKVVDVALDLPSHPTTADESNSAWHASDLGYLNIPNGHCSAVAFKRPYKDILWLSHRKEDVVQRNGRVARGELVIGVSLIGFFGYDGGIREKGKGDVSSKFSMSLKGIEWTVAPSQQYVQSRADDPFAALHRLQDFFDGW